MFVGHFALGFAAKRYAPRQNAAVLMTAPLLLDIVFPILILAGVEKAHVDTTLGTVLPVSLDSMPWSHSLFMSLVWSALYAAGVYLFTKDARGAWICAALVFSHFVCDWVTHRPDLQLWPWSEARVGLGLWYSLPGTLITELLMLAGGAALYFRSTRARDRIGSIVPVVFLVILVGAYLGNVFGPPPPSVQVFSIGIVFSVVLIPLIAWYDAHREAVRYVER